MTKHQRRNTNLRRLFKAVVVISLPILGWQAFDAFTPPQHNPFKPLDLTIEPGIVTALKLRSLGADKPACYVLLDQAGVEYTRLNRASETPECGIADGLTLDRSLTTYSGPVTVSCRLAATLHMWERHVVLPAAQEIFGQGVRRIETMGSYNCRRVNNTASGRWSQHSLGEALDVGGFILDDGARISVEADFRRETPEGEFLRRVRDEACRLFSTTLSPDYNALHENHLHLDMGPYAICS